jgi:hypothetical protein
MFQIKWELIIYFLEIKSLLCKLNLNLIYYCFTFSLNF